MAIPTGAFSHLRLTVTDIARSRAFYDDIFGLPVAVQVPADADQQTREQLWWVFGGVVYQLGDSALFGLRPIAPGTDRFDADRVGLDHVSFAVPGRTDLEDVARQLDDKGVHHEEIKDIGMGFILEFRDPDDIALELFAPKS